MIWYGVSFLSFWLMGINIFGERKLSLSIYIDMECKLLQVLGPNLSVLEPSLESAFDYVRVWLFGQTGGDEH